MTSNGHVPTGELRILLEAQALVEAGVASWETPSNGELVRCHLCQRPLVRGQYVEAGGLLWCPDLETCKREARKLLGVHDGPRRKRGDRRALEQVLRMLDKARREQAEWYVWVVDRAQRRREA